MRHFGITSGYTPLSPGPPLVCGPAWFLATLKSHWWVKVRRISDGTCTRGVEGGASSPSRHGPSVGPRPTARVPPPTTLQRELSLPPAPPGAGSTAPEREPRCPHRSLAAEAVSAPGAGPRVAVRNLRPAPSWVPGLPQPARKPPASTRGSFALLLRPPFYHRPYSFCPLTPPGGKVVQPHLLSPTPASSQAWTRQRMLWSGSPRGQQRIPSPGNETTV